MHSNFAQYIFALNQHQAHKPAFVDQTGSITYGELEQATKQFAYRLRQHGLCPGQRVVIYMDDCTAWPVAFLAMVTMGLNPVPVSADFSVTTLNKIIKISDAVAVVVKDRLSNVDITQFTKDQIIGATTQTVDDFYQFADDEFCLWLLSSGSTGDPKCMVHRHVDFVTLPDLVAGPAYGVNADSKILSTAKLSFTYGLHNSLTIGLSKGATSFLINGVPASSRVFKCLENYAITHFFTVPAVINSMLKHGHDKTLSPTVRVMVSSGEVLPRSASEMFTAQHSIAVLDGLGMGELMYNYCTQSLDNIEPGTVGRPMPGIECKLLNEDGTATEPGHIGELYVRHPCAAVLYWKDWTNTKSTFQGEWVKTNDRLILTPSGNYQYVARSDDLIKVSGHYVSPAEIESAVLEYLDILDCAVIAKPGDSGLNEIHAFVVSDVVTLATVLKQRLSETLPSYKVPKHVHFVSEIPKTVTHKKMRSLLRSIDPTLSKKH